MILFPSKKEIFELRKDVVNNFCTSVKTSSPSERLLCNIFRHMYEIVTDINLIGGEVILDITEYPKEIYTLSIIKEVIDKLKDLGYSVEYENNIIKVIYEQII